MSFNTNIIGVDKEYTVYVPTNYLNYKYIINITSEYIDLTDTSLLEPDNNYDYIRVFFDRPRFVRL